MYWYHYYIIFYFLTSWCHYCIFSPPDIFSMHCFLNSNFCFFEEFVVLEINFCFECSAFKCTFPYLFQWKKSSVFFFLVVWAFSWCLLTNVQIVYIHMFGYFNPSTRICQVNKFLPVLWFCSFSGIRPAKLYHMKVGEKNGASSSN